MALQLPDDINGNDNGESAGTGCALDEASGIPPVPVLPEPVRSSCSRKRLDQGGDCNKLKKVKETTMDSQVGDFKKLKTKKFSGDLQDALDNVMGRPEMPDALKTEIKMATLTDAVHDHFAEVFSPPRIVPILRGRGYGYRATHSWDITHGCDLTVLRNQINVCKTIEQKKIAVLLFCPPCTMFSQIQKSNWNRMDPMVRVERLIDAVGQLDFSVWLMNLQLDRHRYFVFEHPVNASSWTRCNVKKLAARDGVYVVDFDQCKVGLKSPLGTPIQKRTRLLTNIPTVCQHFGKMQCNGCHEYHLRLEGTEAGLRLTNLSQVYPPEMCDLLATAIKEFLGEP